MIPPMTSEPPSEAQPGTSKLRRPHPPQVLTQERVPEVGQPEVAVSEPTGSPDSPAPFTLDADGEVVIDFGDGLTKKESKANLLAAYKDREKVAQMKAQAEAVMARAQAVDHVARAYGSMDENRRRMFEEVLRDPTKLDRLAIRPEAAPMDPEFFATPEPQKQAAHDPRLDQALSLLERHNQILMGLGQERQQVTLTQQVDSIMDAWPVFKEDPGLAELARESVLNSKALNPDKSVESLVEGAASKFARYLQSSRRRSVGEMGLTPSPGTPAKPAFKPDRNALRRGDISRFIAQQSGLI